MKRVFIIVCFVLLLVSSIFGVEAKTVLSKENAILYCQEILFPEVNEKLFNNEVTYPSVTILTDYNLCLYYGDIYGVYFPDEVKIFINLPLMRTHLDLKQTVTHELIHYYIHHHLMKKLKNSRRGKIWVNGEFLYYKDLLMDTEGHGKPFEVFMRKANKIWGKDHIRKTGDRAPMIVPVDEIGDDLESYFNDLNLDEIMDNLENKE